MYQEPLAGGNDDPLRHSKPTYRTTDIWGAAYLYLMGIELLEAGQDERGKNVWLFKNDQDRAWETGREFRTAGVATVPIQEYRESFRRMAKVADAARRERVTANAYANR